MENAQNVAGLALGRWIDSLMHDRLLVFLSVLVQGRKTVFVSCRAMKRMFRCLFLMTWLWHGICEDSSCLLSFQRSKPVTGGGVLDKMSRNVMKF